VNAVNPEGSDSLLEAISFGCPVLVERFSAEQSGTGVLMHIISPGNIRQHDQRQLCGATPIRDISGSQSSIRRNGRNRGQTIRYSEKLFRPMESEPARVRKASLRAIYKNGG